MGCHTWYRKLLTNNQEEIIKKVKNIIAISEDYAWYELKNLNDLLESDEKYLQEIAEYVYANLDYLIKVNGIFGIYESVNVYNIDEPRIGGYPDTIITSADQMFKAMKDGLIGWKGNRCNFSWDKEHDTFIRNNIKNFFKEYPDGIIEFG